MHANAVGGGAWEHSAKAADEARMKAGAISRQAEPPVGGTLSRGTLLVEANARVAEYTARVSAVAEQLEGIAKTRLGWRNEEKLAASGDPGPPPESQGHELILRLESLREVIDRARRVAAAFEAL